MSVSCVACALSQEARALARRSCPGTPGKGVSYFLPFVWARAQPQNPLGNNALPIR